MGVDMFICGSCQWVFHNFEEFMLHKNTVCGENNQNKKMIVKMETGSDDHSNIEQMETYQVIENPQMLGEDKNQGSVEVPPEGSSEILAADQVIKQEATGGEQIIQVQMEGESDQNSAQVVQHHIVQLQSQDSLHQLQIANVPGQSIQLQDIISALQQGQAITVQDGNVLPAEIQVVITAKTDGDNTPDLANSVLAQTVTTAAENSTVTKPARRRGRPRKGEEKNKSVEKVKPVIEEKPKLPERDADGMFTCARCKKRFSKERHYNTHKCLALSDFVDIMEKELINMADESDSDDSEQVKDADFRAPSTAKKRKYMPLIVIKPQNDTDSSYTSNQDKEQDVNTKTKDSEDKPLDPSQSQREKSETSGLVNSMDDVSDLTKEGLADFPGAGDVKLSQVRVEDGTDEPKLQDSLTAPLDGGLQEGEVYKSRRGRKPKGVTMETGITRQTIKNLPIFKCEEDRLEFEKCTNVDLSEVDGLYRQHVINQDVNEYAPLLKNRVSDKLSVFSCNICEKIIMTKSHARLHCLTHTDLKPFRCFKCQFATNTKGNLYSHMRKHTGQLYRCSVCSFSTINKGHLIEHEAVHSTKRHECEICHKDYSTVKSLYGHVRRKHGNNKKGKDYMLSISGGHSRGQAILHQCHICNRKFKKKIDRDRHMYMHNIKDNPNVFSCDLCNRTCSRKAYLERHLLRHRIIYFCSECDQRFPSTLHLTQHLAETHLGGGNVAEELLKQKFEKCIENSIYLPEPDGSVSFEEEVEEPDVVLFSTDTGVEDQKSNKDLNQSEEADGSTGIDNEAVLAQVSMTRDDGKVKPCGLNVSDEAAVLIKTENQSLAPEVNNEQAADEDLNGVNLPNNSDSPQTNQLDPVSSENVSENQSSVNQCTSQSNTEDVFSVPVINASSAAMDSSNVSHEERMPDDQAVDVNRSEIADAETGAVMMSSESEAASNSSETVYDKNFFKNMGFKALNLNIYNQIRQVFGKEECQFCGRLYFSAADFEQHLRTHTGERPFGCNQCNYRAINKENLKRHIEKEHDKVKFTCNKCNFVASNRTQLWSHIQGHKNPDAYSCPSCGRTFSQPKKLKIHINITHPDMSEIEVKMATSVPHRARAKIGRKCYRCPHCDRGLFRNAADLQKHVWIHEGIKPFKCPLCPHACRSRNNLASHMIRHSLDKPFLCTECGRAYKSKTALRWHVRSHKDGKFKCPKCPYEATQTSHLKRHMETHNIIKRYVCQQCSYSANTLGYLKIHYARHHKGQQFTHSNTVMNQIPVVHTVPDAETKIYRCLGCDYLFGNLSDMKRHLKLRHHMQLENVSLLEELPVSGEVSDGMPRMLTVNTIGTEESGQEVVTQQDLNVSEVQVVKLADPLDVTVGTMAAQDTDTSIQPLQYSVTPGESEDRIQSAVNILQQIIGMSQQGTLAQQEITVKSQEGQSFIVQQQDDVDGTKHNSGQYVIQYVMTDGQEITAEDQEAQQVISKTEVMTEGEAIAQKVEVQQQDIAGLPVDVQTQDVSTLAVEQTAEALDTRAEHTQTLVLDFDATGSVSSGLPANIVHMSNIGVEEEMTTGVLTLDGSADTLTNIN